MSMDSNRQNILTNYISYLYTTGRTYDTVGKYIKHVTDFFRIDQGSEPSWLSELQA